MCTLWNFELYARTGSDTGPRNMGVNIRFFVELCQCTRSDYCFRRQKPDLPYDFHRSVIWRRRPDIIIGVIALWPKQARFHCWITSLGWLIWLELGPVSKRRLRLIVYVKSVSDDTIFAHDCLRFASRGVGRNLIQSCAIGWNLS